MPVASTNDKVERRGLDILDNTMRACSSKYSGVGWVKQILRHFLSSFNQSGDKPTQQDNDQESLILKNPVTYLRLTLTLDLGLRNNRLPMEEEYPVELRNFPQCVVPSIQELSKARKECSMGELKSFEGWIENDRSLYFAREMGLGLEV
jgi:hypothetical protein